MAASERTVRTYVEELNESIDRFNEYAVECGIESEATNWYFIGKINPETGIPALCEHWDEYLPLAREVLNATDDRDEAVLCVDRVNHDYRRVLAALDESLAPVS